LLYQLSYRGTKVGSLESGPRTAIQPSGYSGMRTSYGAEVGASLPSERRPTSR
jgi:hypothetical protein